MRIKQALELAAFELGKAKVELARRQEEYDRLFKLVVSGAKSVKTNSKPSDRTRTDFESSKIDGTDPNDRKDGKKLSAMKQIENLLAGDPDKEWSNQEIQSKMPSVQKDSITALLFRLRRAGSVAKVGRGKWKANRLI